MKTLTGEILSIKHVNIARKFRFCDHLDSVAFYGLSTNQRINSYGTFDQNALIETA